MDLRARSLLLAQNLKQNYADLTAVLIAMHRQKLFVKHGFTGVFTYCQEELELSDAQSYYFQKVVQSAVNVPKLEAAVTSGELSLSQARRIVPVISKSNAAEWIEKAKALPQRELERAVAAVNPMADHVERIRLVSETQAEIQLTVSHEVAALLRRVQELESQRTKKSASLEDVLKMLTTNHVEKHDPVKKAERAKPLPKEFPEESQRALPMPVKHAVNRRDQGRCTHVSDKGKRCDSQRWLEIHHRVPLAKGGPTSERNLITLCATHHRHEHATV